METIRFSVEGMSCDGCARGLTAALRFMPGVTNVDTRYADGEVTIEYDADKVNPTELRSEIGALAYKVID